jgi:predicted esterase
MLMLHGRGGDGPRMMAATSFGKFAADRNYILAAPTAQKLSKASEGEDGGSDDVHWWCFKPGSSIFAALREIRRRYVVDDNRIIVTGYSMGGFGAQGTGFRYPDRFSAMVAFAGGLSRVEYAVTTGDPRLRPIVENGLMLPTYLLHGDKDETVPPTFDRLTRDQLKKFGAEHVYVEVAGAGHGLDTRTLSGPIIKWLEPRKRDPHPKKITFVSVDDYSASCYWIKLDGKPVARVEAEIKKNTIDVSATDATSVTIFLDDTRVDPGKPVVVTSGGRELFSGKVADSLDAVLESWKDREDPQLVYRAKVTVELK